MAAPSLFYAVAVLSLVVVLVVVESGSAAPPPDTRIVGGRKIEIDDAPWQVALMFKVYHVCGGSIISPQWVLTAAHCVLYPASFYKIRIGSKMVNESGKLYDVFQVIYHGAYNLHGYNDLGLLKTATPMDLSAPVRAVRLPALGDKRPSVGTMLTVTGWGLMENKETTSELMSVDVQVQEYKHCTLYAGTTEETGICAGLPGKDSCIGDSGGPLVMGDLLVGVVSHGENATCGTSPGVYMDVAFYMDWIQLHTGL